MKKSLWVLGAVAALAIAACAPAPPPMKGTADDEVALRGMAGRYSAAFNANDAAALQQDTSDDFESIGPDGVHTKGRAAAQQMDEAGMKERQAAGLKLTLTATTGYVTWIDATHAVVAGTYTMAGLPPGASDKGAWMLVAKKGADGKWKSTNSLVSELPAPPPPPPPAKGK